MAKIRITENELKQIIRESVDNVIASTGNGVGPYWKGNPLPDGAEKDYPTGSGPQLTRGQVDTVNTNATNALTAWKKLGTVGQIKTIQRLAGIPAAQCDGRIGPQTLAKVYIALSKGKAGEAINADDLSKSSFQPGKTGTYAPR